MKLATGLLPAILSIAIGIAAMVMLCIRVSRHAPLGKETENPLPASIRWCRAPARLLLPLISGFVPADHERMLRTLAANDLHPQLTPDLWISIRCVHGIMAMCLLVAVSGTDFLVMTLVVGATGFLAGGVWLRRLNRERERQIARELPAYLDLLTVSVEAGATLTAGVRLIVAQAPDSPLRRYFERVLREVRSGRPRAQAFIHVAEMHGVESLSTLANALSHAEATGMSLGQILRTQSEQRTAERFARAERLAMQAPVKMLGPLIFCIFPCTFIVLAVPVVVRMMEAFHS
jgi:tight adherence protein C